MPANEWNVRIISTATGPAFEPRVPGGTPGGQLLAQAGDIVTWGNATNATQQPWPLDANGNLVPAANPESATPGYMSDPIPANSSSTPQYVIGALAVGTVINYCLRQDQNVRGSIKIF